MLKILKRIAVTDRLTEEPPSTDPAELEALGIEVHRALGKQFTGSLAIRHIDAGSCNGCELEIHAVNNAYYDIERFGVHFVASPRHADALLVTGVVSRHMENALRRTWQATPSPKWVIAAGDCACTGGIFGQSYASCGRVSNVIPVDLTISGCPPSPKVLLQGILALLNANLEQD